MMSGARRWRSVLNYLLQSLVTCVYICMHTYMSCMCVYIHTHTAHATYMCVCIHTHNARKCMISGTRRWRAFLTCLLRSLVTCVYIRMRMYIYMCVYTCTHDACNIHVRICTHTHNTCEWLMSGVRRCRAALRGSVCVYLYVYVCIHVCVSMCV